MMLKSFLSYIMFSFQQEVYMESVDAIHRVKLPPVMLKIG